MSRDQQTARQPQFLDFGKQNAIFDNVHGFIQLTDIEVRLINTMEFQRLRNIRQLGLLNYIFPGALHTRFNHSIGVLHIVDKMVVSLQHKGHLQDSEENRQILRIAGLLHDIGHYPWSHVTEHVVINDLKKTIRSFPKDNDTIIVTGKRGYSLGGASNSDKKEVLQVSPSHQINKEFHEPRNESLDFAHHERIASIVINKTEIKDILSEVYGSDEIKKISQIIAGTTPSIEKSLIHSELDADRFDYLLRDSKQTGVTYGLFDLDQIIRNLDYSQDAPEGTSGFFIHRKGKKAVEDYLLARYFLYSTVIYQKTSIGFHKMANIVYEGLLERGEIESYFDILGYFDDGENIEDFYNYNDLTILQKIRKVAKGDISLDNRGEYNRHTNLIRDCCEKIINRKPLKLVIENQRVVNKTETAIQFDNYVKEPAVINEVVRLAGIEKYWYIPSEIQSSITNLSPLIPIDGNDFNPKAKEEGILIGDEKNNPILLVTEDSLIIKQLADSSLKINAIYTKNDSYKHKILKAIEAYQKSTV